MKDQGAMSDKMKRHQKAAAIFIDAENHSDLAVSALAQRLERFDIVEQRAYADWRNLRLDHLARRLTHANFEMHHTWSGMRQGAQKNKADGQMERDILCVISRRPEIEAVVIVSGDAFFARVAHQLAQKDKWVIVVADPFRVSKELRTAAHEYLAVGKLGKMVQGLDHLERHSRYLTFRFVVQKLKVKSADLSELIHKGLLIQEEIRRPGRGARREIRLNRQAFVVQAALSSAV